MNHLLTFSKLKKDIPLSPEERVIQARLRLLAAVNQVHHCNINVSSITIVFFAGMLTGMFPSFLQSFSREAASLMRIWLSSRLLR